MSFFRDLHRRRILERNLYAIMHMEASFRFYRPSSMHIQASPMWVEIQQKALRDPVICFRGFQDSKTFNFFIGD